MKGLQIDPDAAAHAKPLEANNNSAAQQAAQSCYMARVPHTKFLEFCKAIEPKKRIWHDETGTTFHLALAALATWH